MRKTERYKKIIEWFRLNMLNPQTELFFATPFQLLTAVILSAQCTDKRVNIVTQKLFETYADPFKMADASQPEIFQLIKSISYPNNKSKHLYEMSRMLVSRYSGEVPSEVEELIKLPGVGRKTANVVASIIYDRPVIAVDTHVFRVSRRVGLSNGKNVMQVEQDLTNYIEESLRAKAHHWLILHGRYVCTARKPKCVSCGIREWCKSANRYLTT